ncbi:MAG: glycosyltransferase family 39 protein [Ferruginibacter sp.]
MIVNKTVILVFFIILKFTLHWFLIAPGFDLHRDEYLHLDQAKHLAWGFESVPPFTSWISFIILKAGSPVWLIKFFPALFGALTMLVVWKTIELLKGNLFALVLGAIAVTLSVILRMNILYQPNSFDILCWTALYYYITRYINDGNSSWLYYAACVFGIGFLNKYNIIFLVAGLVPALLITELRKIFLNRNLYFAIATGLLIISPNLIWQYQNNFPVIGHMQELTDTQLVNVNRMDFIKEQLLFFTGSIFIILAAFISFFIYPEFKKYRILFYSYIFTIFLFIYFKGKGYYAIGLYPIFLAFGSVYLERLLQHKPFYYLRIVMLFITTGLSVPLLMFAFPLYTPEKTALRAPMYKKLGMLKWEDGNEHALPQDFADMLGWKELAAKTDNVFTSIKGDENTLVLCDNYGQAGAINFYSKQNLQAVSFNADYINWFDFSRTYNKIILVKENEDPDPMREEEKKYFKNIITKGKVENKLARESGTTIFLLDSPTTQINEILKEEIINRKKNK